VLLAAADARLARIEVDARPAVPGGASDGAEHLGELFKRAAKRASGSVAMAPISSVA